MAVAVSRSEAGTCAKPAEVRRRSRPWSRIASDLAALAPSYVCALLPQLSRYTIVSVVALGIDVAIFMALTVGMHVWPAAAGAAGYGLGLLVHFVLSSRFVFQASAAKSTLRLFGEFALSGLVGMAITIAVIWAMTALLHLPAPIAKAAAVAASFLAVFALRRQVVFRDVGS